MENAIEKISGQTSDQLVELGNSFIQVRKYKKCIDEINGILDDLKYNFFNLGKYLNEVSEDKLYLVSNYKDIYDLGKQEFGFEKTSIKNFISVYKAFKSSDDRLDDRFKSFSFSQLIEMIPISEDKDFCTQLESLSVKTIRKVKRNVVDLEKLSKDKYLVVFKEVIKYVSEYLKSQTGFTKFTIKQNENFRFGGMVYVLQFENGIKINISLSYSDYSRKVDLYFEVFEPKDFWSVRSLHSDFITVRNDFPKWIKDCSKKYEEYEKENDKSKISNTSKVVDAVPLKSCTLKNNNLREEYVMDIKNWDYVGTISESDNLKLTIFKFKAYPEYIKILVGCPTPATSQNIKEAQIYKVCEGNKDYHSYLTNVNYSTIVVRLKDDRY